MACEQRDLFPGEQLSGANVDVTAAYTQGPQSAATAKLHATQLSVLSETKKWITIIVIYLVGIFGFTRAGHVYCTFASTIDQAHNDSQPARRSRTYIDDGILISPERLIDDSLEAYIALVVALFGLDGANKEKIKKWPDRVEAIGWVLDLRTWLATPKKKGLDKMLVYLFDRISPGTRTASTKDIERLVGLLSWYTPGIPAGSSFLGSLFACKSRGYYKVKLSPLAIHDLNWWRAIALLAYQQPDLLGANIDYLRRVKTPSIFLRTDASSLTGGGGYLSTTYDGPPMDLPGGAIRWTRQEIAAFIDMGISINVLEYFTAVYYIMLWLPQTRGQLVMLEVDNTSAVSWILSKRASRNASSDVIAKLFSLFCLSHNIHVECSHIRGVDNTIADFRSRALDLLPQDADEAIVHGTKSERWSRTDACRRLLYLCVTKPEEMHGQALLNALTDLAGSHGPPSAV